MIATEPTSACPRLRANYAGGSSLRCHPRFPWIETLAWDEVRPFVSRTRGAHSEALCLLVCTVLIYLPSPLSAQIPNGNTSPAAIISSGGIEPAVGNRRHDALPPTANTGNSFAESPRDAWTSERNPTARGGDLRPQSPASVPLQGNVVSAGAVANVNEARVPDARSESTLAAISREVQHIPIAPPSERLTSEKPKPSSSTLQTLVSVISSLLLVLGLFLGVAWCYRKALSTTHSGSLPKQVVNVLGRTSISARQQMVLVRFGSKLLLVSVIQGEARTLGEISDPLEVDQMLGMCESGQPGSISQTFKSLLLSEGKA